MPSPPRVHVTCPAPRGSRTGNRVTAERWARILRELGARVRIGEGPAGEGADLLVALHARRSAPAVSASRRGRPARPVVVALTGTDLYPRIARGSPAWRTVHAADLLVVLHGEAPRDLPVTCRKRARVVHQSVVLPSGLAAPARGRFDICVLGHLRPVKDPLRTALAVRGLPAASKARVVHLGEALDERSAERARAETERNPRYRWLGARPRSESLRRLAKSHLLVLTSKSEGGANVIGEAAVAGVPVLSTRIAGSLGLLGRDYEGYFEVGDTRGLRELLLRAETDRSFYARLKKGTRRIAPLFEPRRERESWRGILAELGLAVTPARTS